MGYERNHGGKTGLFVKVMVVKIIRLTLDILKQGIALVYCILPHPVDFQLPGIHVDA